MMDAHCWAAVIADAIHVVPLGDLRDHELHCRCWCCPVEDADEADLWVHNAMDQRERYETGELRPQ